MKKKSLILGVSILISCTMFSMASCDNKNKTVKLATMKDTVSWVMGENIARGFKETGIEMDNKIVLQAIENCLEGKPSMVSDSVFNTIIEQVSFMMMMNQRNKQAEAEKNASVAEKAYFENLEKDPTIQKTSSGLHYKIIKKGTGPNAFKGGRVRFHYKASDMNGQVFDETYGLRDPILTVVSNVFPGLAEGFQLMNGGSQYVFYIPYALAFGSQGTEGVPPYATVIYEVELLQVMD